MTYENHEVQLNQYNEKAGLFLERITTYPMGVLCGSNLLKREIPFLTALCSIETLLSLTACPCDIQVPFCPKSGGCPAHLYGQQMGQVTKRVLAFAVDKSEGLP